MFLWLLFPTFIFYCVVSVYCTSDASNPTPAQVLLGGEAVLQCEYDSNRLIWEVYEGVIPDRIASGGDVTDSSKYSVYKNPSTGLYYKLHILNIGVSDLKKYRCETVVNGGIHHFYLKLDLLSRYNYILGNFKVGTSFFLLVVLNYLLKLGLLSCVKCLWFLVTPHYQTHRELLSLTLQKKITT